MGNRLGWGWRGGGYLVDVMSGNDGVKHGVEVVQEVHHLLTHTHTQLKQACRAAPMTDWFPLTSMGSLRAEMVVKPTMSLK